MKFKLINMDNWERKEHFHHYTNQVPCSYSVSITIDITKLLLKIKKHNIKLYPAIIYALSTIVNQHNEFKTSQDEDGNIGYFDIIHPAYTIFHKDTETFSSIWTEHFPDFSQFHNNYLSDTQLYHNNKNMFPKKNYPSNLFNISMIPWIDFSGFNLNLSKNENYFLPIFTIGKYTKNDDKNLLPIAIQVNHAVCDGFHVARFINDLQALINASGFIQ